MTTEQHISAMRRWIEQIKCEVERVKATNAQLAEDLLKEQKKQTRAQVRIAEALEAANDLKGLSETVEKIDKEFSSQQQQIKDAVKPGGGKGGK